jgi:hypothetical protein
MQGRPQDALPEIERVRNDPVRTFLVCDCVPRAWSSFESNEALEWLDRAYTKHDDGLIFTKVDRLLKSLHNYSRFPMFLKKLNLPN